MNAIQTLLWLEFKRASWVLYAAAMSVALFALVLYSLPATTTGFDMLNIPVAGEEPDCLPPDCGPSGGTQVEIQREQSDRGSSFGWSFSKSWGGEPDPTPSTRNPQSAGQTIPVAVPEELQFALRWRQVTTLAAGFLIPTLMLLGFWISYSREADRGDMVMLYQAPVSGELQLFVRLLFMSATMLAVSAGTIGIYWALQKSQSLAPLAPLVEALGGHANIHWGNLILSGLVTMTLPNAAFVLLFIQMQNAYDLLGGQRLAGLILILVSLVAFFVSFFGGEPQVADTVLRIVSVESNPMLDSVVGDTSLGWLRVEVPVRTLAMSAAFTALMLFLSGRIWREVEWS